ncbi:hypothetical protein FXO38_25899 [Capsicum annuum]|nr:hypothetical protein FXO38_25899 [Capsicum annuum]KAF3659889.1 hypothetical protein FXO37_13797 [Capsicum annuum]
MLSDAANKQALNQHVSQWINELRDAVDGAENLMEEVNYEALRLKVEGPHQNLAETSNQQVSGLKLLSDDFFLNIKEKLEDTIEALEDLQNQIGLLGLKEHFLRLNEKLEHLQLLWLNLMSLSVALMMRTEKISMDTLSIDDSWSLFKIHAFENMDPMEHPELEEVGKDIVAKCKGLPLALKTLAGMLCFESEVEG